MNHKDFHKHKVLKFSTISYKAEEFRKKYVDDLNEIPLNIDYYSDRRRIILYEKVINLLVHNIN